MLLLLATVALVFSGALRGGFIWDDTQLIAENKYIKSFEHIGRNLSHGFWEVSGGDGGDKDLRSQANLYYRPLVTLSLMTDFWLHGQRPWGYHLTNLLLHLAAVLLAYALLRRAFELSSGSALIVALLFAVHPSRAEAVTWISGRSELLMAVFALASLLCFRRALVLERGRGPWFAGALLAYVAAVLSKETAVALAVVVPALDWLMVSRGDRHRLWARARWCHLPLVLASAAYVSARLLHQATVLGERPRLPLGQHVTMVLESVGAYARLVLAPYHPSTQVGAHHNPAHPSWTLVCVGGAVLAAGIAGLVLARRRAPRAALALVLAAAFLLPVANVVPLRIHVLVAERFLYLPLLGLMILLGVAASAISRWVRPAVLLSAVGVLAASWALTVTARNPDFTDPERFWRAELRRSPDNPLVQLELAQTLVRQHRAREAEALFFSSFYDYRLVVGDPGNPLRALFGYLDARLLRASDADQALLRQVATFLEKLAGVGTEPAAASATLHLDGREITVRTRSAATRRALLNDRAALLATLGAVLSRLGDDAKAEEALAGAVRLRPGRLSCLMNLALVRARRLDLAGARTALERAQGAGAQAPALTQLATALKEAEVRARKLQALSAERAARGPSTSSETQEAWLLAELYMVTRAPMRAVAELERVIRLSPQDRRAWATLSLELAALGRLKEALGVLQRARRSFGEEPGLAQLEAQVRAVAASSGFLDRGRRVTPSAAPR